MDVETGRMAWYYQTSPHDTHDWDSAQTPILIDGTIGGVPHKLVSTVASNGASTCRSPLAIAVTARASSSTCPAVTWTAGTVPA